MIALILLLAFAGPGPRPRPAVTPGLTRPLSTETVCATVWHLDRRHVTTAMKRQVAKAYGVAWETRSAYEFDHLIPRSLGGADDARNLWPQPWAGPWGARQKDRLEVRLGRLVCDGTLSLEAAQTAIRKDWIAAFRRYVEPAK